MFFDGSKMLNGSEEINSDMFFKSTLIPLTTRQNTKHFYMGCAWPFHSASVASWSMATQIGGQSSDEGMGRQKSSHDWLLQCSKKAGEEI